MFEHMKALPKALILGTIAIAAVFGGKAALQSDIASSYLKPKTSVAISVPDKIDLPTAAGVMHGGAPSSIKTANVSSSEVIRTKVLAWNGEAGLAFANGGIDTAAGSLMDKRGLKVKLVREDDYSKMIADMAAFAKDPSTGVHFVVIMGDGYPAFAVGANEALKPFGQSVKVVAGIGYSRGEDKCVTDAGLSSLRGALIAGVLGDGDINICIKKAADDGIAVNANAKTYDPQALNFVGTKDFVEADEKFIAGYCEDRDVVGGGRKKVCVNGSATWTPGDVKLATKRGNIKVMASTKEYAWQMPATVIGNTQWMSKNREVVKAFLAAALEGGEAVRSNDGALLKAGEAEAKIFGEETGSYWAKYFKGVVEMDKTGNQLFLGGSTTNGLADNAFLFGLNGNDNLYKKVYTVYGNIAVKYFPDIMPGGLQKYDDVVDTSYLQELLASSTNIAPATTPSFGGQTTEAFATKAYAIEFNSGKATFTADAVRVLNDLLDQAAITSLNVQIAGHTDNIGDPVSNIALSKARAEAVKNFLMQNAPKNFPDERVSTRGFGDAQPLGDNKTAAGKAKNRRVEITLRK